MKKAKYLTIKKSKELYNIAKYFIPIIHFDKNGRISKDDSDFIQEEVTKIIRKNARF